MKHIHRALAGAPRRTGAPGLPARQRGAIAIMTAMGLVVIIGFLALALDLSQLYNRRIELQNAADAVALAAAHELNGSSQGITNALQHASDRFSASAPGALTYHYGQHRLSWSPSAIAFSDSPTGPWQDAEEARARPARLLYVRVDTDRLPGEHGRTQPMFLRIFSDATLASTRATAVAGRSGLRVTPLGICAMRDASHRDRHGELEEHGFRRGVGYNLLELARDATGAGQTYIVNPLPGPTPITSEATLAPFVCTGTIAMTRLTGAGKAVVSSPFPLAGLYQHLNSRFGAYTASSTPCDSRTAPSDGNTMEYTFNGGSPWMAAQPQGQAAALLVSEGRRWTIAGPDVTPPGTTAIQFGPLWAYARAVPYSAYTPGQPEPAAGYPTYNPGDWSTLYYPGKPETSSTTPYPSSPTTPTPYSHTSGETFYRAPPAGNKFLRGRRVLNLPLLECPVSGNRATVLAIGRFFMTTQATSTSLYGEFGGLVPEQALGTNVVLYP